MRGDAYAAPMLLAVTVLGHDRPGIIADVTGALAELGGNLEDSSMTLLRGHFAWTLIVDLAADAAAATSRLGFLRDEGLVVSVLPVPEESAPAAVGSAHLLSVHGADRPGIVSAVTRVIAEAGGNVTDLTTRLGGELYVVVAEVDLPAGVDPGALSERLRSTAAELGVDAVLRPADADDL
jgi:glycine cleavage system transcriptional repressor